MMIMITIIIMIIITIIISITIIIILIIIITAFLVKDGVKLLLAIMHNLPVVDHPTPTMYYTEGLNELFKNSVNTLFECGLVGQEEVSLFFIAIDIFLYAFLAVYMEIYGINFLSPSFVV
jgi:hypothetical protein